MARIELIPEEVDMLRLILESDLADLRMEIAGTENMDFRQDLKEVEMFLKKVLRQLEGEALKVFA